jgi:hypothetical protein
VEVEITCVEKKSIVLQARASELLILPQHVLALGESKSPKDFSEYFMNEALVNRSARKLFQAWLRKDRTLWQRLYRTIRDEADTNEIRDFLKNMGTDEESDAEPAVVKTKAVSEPAVKKQEKPAVAAPVKSTAAKSAPKAVEKAEKPAKKEVEKKEKAAPPAKKAAKAEPVKKKAAPAKKAVAAKAKPAKKAAAVKAVKKTTAKPVKKTAAKATKKK